MANQQMRFLLVLLVLKGLLFGDEKSIVVIIPSYNNQDWVQWNLDSVLKQDYQNYRIIYIDDASTDRTGSIVQEIIHKNPFGHLVKLIRNQKRMGALANIYRAVWECGPSDIIVTVDGDDWLAHEGVLQRVNAAYSDPDVWITYGQKVEYPTGFAGGAELIPFEIIQKNCFRDFDWVGTHLRTFYAGLFQKIKKEDFLYEGEFFPVAWDLSFMFPMLEMAGFHSRFISDILYVYNIATPLSDRKLYLEQQRSLDSYIRTLPRYEPIQSPFETSPFVTCDLRGGLGNQLFQIATTLSYAWEYDAKPIFPGLLSNEMRIADHKDRIFFRLDAIESPKPFPNHFYEANWHSSEQIPFRPDQKLFGYFQSWKRFDLYRDQLLNLFAPSKSILQTLSSKYENLIGLPNTVAIHVRTFNASLHHSKKHPFVGLEYFQNAMNFFPRETVFVIFSDRIQWCKQHFFQKNCIFIEGNNPVEDLFLMSMMKHQIICNSTFSWWGAYLNQNPEKTVIAPTSWMHPDIDPFPLSQPNEFYLPEWKLISPNYSAPYPEDMTWYETSIDDLLFN